jgi:hypothetical protein
MNFAVGWRTSGLRKVERCGHVGKGLRLTAPGSQERYDAAAVAADVVLEQQVAARAVAAATGIETGTRETSELW